jgi:hypothetical protein
MSIELTTGEASALLPPHGDRLCYASPNVPFHFSVGVVALSSLHPEDARVATLYSPPEYENPFGITDFDQLIRETPENGESLEAAVQRGLVEEIGATQSRIVAPLPGSAGVFQGRFQSYHKTTMYFLAHVPLEGICEGLRDDQEAEINLRLVWRSLSEAITRQKLQRPRVLAHGRSDLIEVDQLEAARELLNQPEKLANR